jgi:glyoxalase family protein
LLALSPDYRANLQDGCDRFRFYHSEPQYLDKKRVGQEAGMPLRGLHHVTTISGGARRAHEFYGHFLGLRLVKRTVSYEDPGTYQLYYGDRTGSVGSIISILVWQHVAPGMSGVGEAVETAFRIPLGTVDWWCERFNKRQLDYTRGINMFGENAMRFVDPDGTKLALVEKEGIDRESAWPTADIGGEHAIRGLCGVTLSVRDAKLTLDILKNVLGFSEVVETNNLFSAISQYGPGGRVSLQEIGRLARGRLGGGTIQTVVCRAADTADLESMLSKLRAEHGITPGEIEDRAYYRSVSFRAPCGTLFAIATDEPGFALDESPDQLGETLKLPASLEGRRVELQLNLSRLE